MYCQDKWVSNYVLQVEASTPKWQFKTSIDVMGRWLDLKRSPLTLCCDDLYTFPNIEIEIDLG